MKKKVKIVVILLLMCLLPAALCISGSFVTAYQSMKTAIEDETEEELQSVGYVLLEAFDAIDDGEYKLVGGILFKGLTNLSGSYEIIDYIKGQTGVESTLFYGDTRYMTSLLDENGERMINTQCSDEVRAAVLERGQTYFGKNVNIGGKEYYAYYIPIEQNGKIVGMIFTGKSTETVTENIIDFTRNLVIVSTVLVVFVLLVALWAGRRTSKHINMLREDTVKLSEGNLDFEIRNENIIQELYDLAEAARSLQSHLVEVVHSILQCADTVESSVGSVDELITNCSLAVKDLSGTMEEVAYAAQNTAESVEKEASDMDVISENISEIASSSQSTQGITATVSDVSRAAKSDLEDLLRANSNTTESANEVIASISSVSDAVNQITAATQMIMDISSQTNLLSLNASIEAARAGEAGRGFAVVASEIQKLAEQSNSSAEQIRGIIETIMSKTRECTEIAGKIQGAVEQESMALKNVRESFGEVESNIGEASVAVNQIKEIVDAVEERKKSILDSIDSLSSVSEENAASAQQSNASTEELRANIEEVESQATELRSVVEQLTKSVSFFQLGA